MVKYDWTANIKTNIFLLRMCGLWPNGDESYKLNFYSFYLFIIASTFIVGHLVFEIANIYFIRNDLTALTGTAYIVFLKLLVAFKSYQLVKNMKMLKQLLKTLDLELFQPTNMTQIEQIEENIWAWRLVYRIFSTMSVIANLFWTLYPLMDSSVPEKQLPFLAWYPYDTTKSPMYEITYLYQMSDVAILSVIHVNIDAFVAAVNVFNGSQFDILANKLEHLHELEGNISENLIKCIEHHKEILRYSDKCNIFLNWILVMQFAVSSLEIGLSLFQLTLMVPLSNQFNSLVAYEAAITVQIFMYCWFGNEVEFKSSRITYASFKTEWVDFPEQTKKDLLFFMLRSQKTVKLSALSLFYLNVDTFTRILRTAWSYFALLKTM